MSNHRRNLIRLAAELPAGSAERKNLLALLTSHKTAAGDTWFRHLSNAKTAFLKEVAREAMSAFRDEGYTNSLKTSFRGTSVLVQGVNEDGKIFTVNWGWDGDRKIKGTVFLSFAGERGEKASGKVMVLSKNPMQVASEFIYKHLQGVIR